MKKTMTLVGAGAVVGVGALVVAAASFTADADEPGDDAGVDVVGGEPAEEGQFPYMVALANADDPAFNFCGGSLIAEDVVLTAAHCLEGEEVGNLVVRHGSVDLESDEMTDYPAEALHISEEFDPDMLSHDWGLIKLAEPVEDAEVVAVPDADEFDAGPEFDITGWGVTTDGDPAALLQWATAPFVDDEQCATAFEAGELDPETMVCAGDWDDGGVDTCQGDSGGPMVNYTSEGEPIVIGITSWGYGCAEPQSPGVYSQVSAFAEGINAVLDEWNSGDEA
ncbi:MAG: serine protease [Stackebrandtia sp.]